MTILSHLVGTPGSGKTYLGNLIKLKNKNVKVIDTDIWRAEFYSNKDIIQLNNKLVRNK